MPYDNLTIHSETYKGYHISIEADRDPFDPRELGDSPSTMICFHRQYDLGDEHSYSSPLEAVAGVCDIEMEDLEDRISTLARSDRSYGQAINEAMDEALDKAPIYCLPLYLYDHSGITMSTRPFSCPWDSGQVGIIYITKERAEELWPRQDGESDKDYDHRIEQYLRGDVEVYDHYITGSVWGYVISKPDAYGGHGEEVDSCWGFFGDYEDTALAEAKSYIDALVN